MSREHRIKLQECYCDTVMMRDKRAELRVTDEGRPAEHEITDKRYTITHVLTNVQGLIPGYAVLSIREVQK